MALSRLLRKPKGVSSLLAAVLLIAVVVIGGVILFWAVQSNILGRGPAARLEVAGAYLVRDTQGHVVFSITVKNAGSLPCKAVNVTLDGEQTAAYDLSASPLEPGRTVTLAPTLSEVYILGNSYSVQVAGEFSDGSTTALTYAVQCTGAGGFVETRTVVFSATGLDQSAAGTALTVDGAPYDASELPKAFTWVRGSTHSFEWSEAVSSSDPGKRFAWRSTSGLSSARAGTVLAAIDGSVTAAFGIEYRLNLTASAGGTTNPAPGIYWYADETGVDVTAQAIPPCELDYWEVNGSPDGNEATLHLVMDQPYDVRAVFRVAEVQVTFEASGLASDASGIVLTIDNVYQYAYADLPKSFSWIIGSTHTYAYSATVSSTSDGKRYSLSGVDGPSSPMMVTSAVTIRGDYATQWLVTFDQAGLDPTANGAVVTINGTAKSYADLPYSFWANSSAQVTYSYSDTVPSSTSGKRFNLTSVSGPSSPITVTSPTTVTGNYAVQYCLTIATVPSAGGSTDPPVGAYWYNAGSSVPVTAYPASGYGFVCWLLDGSNVGADNPYTVSMTQAHMLQAQFAEMANVTFRVSGFAGTGTVLVVDNTYYLGREDLPRTFTWDVGSVHSFVWYTPIYHGTDKRYVWLSTTGLASTATGFITVPPGGGDVNATYGTEYRLVISSADPSQGTTDPTPGDYWYASTSSAVVTAQPSSGYAFDYWSLDGAANTDNPITIPMSTSHTLVANFMTAVFYKWSDGTTANSITLSYNLFNGTFTHDSNATYGIKSTGVYTMLNVNIYINSISNVNVIENVTLIIRNPSGAEVARVSWATGNSLPTAPQAFAIPVNTVYTIEVWLKGGATVSDVSVEVKLTTP